MIYPEFIKNGDYIGVTAPSDGVTDILDLKRLDNADENITEERNASARVRLRRQTGPRHGEKPQDCGDFRDGTRRIKGGRGD